MRQLIGTITPVPYCGVGVNTFLPKDNGGEIAIEIELIRSTEEEKGQQIANVKR